MPLTPADIHNVAFKKPSIGKRGYDEEEVDAFLDEVEREIERLAEENTALRAQVELGAGPGDGGAATRLPQLRAQLDRLQRERVAAEQAAQEVQRQLEEARTRSVGNAPEDAGTGLPVLVMAQRTADECLSKARLDADQLLTEMRARAEKLAHEAQRKAQKTESQAVDRHKKAIERLEADRSAAQREIATLTHFAHDYRERLAEHLNALMNDMSGGGAKNGRAEGGAA
ncbi:DivIVA domain-containing protein [Micromonospora cathayae]|uniref:Cell wall synthesis protein Wag31 n=1 Tax=Micromonospora cathayae TaxID=3028804 RepID=A0ABY7ZL75_9ACTN|nr:DivIVA domain-containing protein [Micromonospora sp. HUAS 3]WDZ83719.1 DivIVA domain-containing protein [Micromonospora sp. HUAS 3]